MSILINLIRNITFLSFLLTLISFKFVFAGTATLIRYYDTYSNGIILSTDPSGLTFNGRHILIVDSEINETGPPPPGYFLGYNMFEVNLDGSVLYNQYITTPQSGGVEPTGICFNPKDGNYYITNDKTRKLYRYELNENLLLVNSWDLKGALFADSNVQIDDPEGIGVNPINGLLYIIEGKDGANELCKILVVSVQKNAIALVDSFTIKEKFVDPEGVAFHENSGNLYIASGSNTMIYKYDLLGHLVDEYDLSGFSPEPRSFQGLTFAPSSSEDNRLSLYIADGGIDASPDRARIYEVDLGDDVSLSVDLFSFKALERDGKVKLEWETINLHEDIVWSIEKRDQDSDEFSEISRVSNPAIINKFEFVDQDVFPGKTYYYRLKDIDKDGVSSVHQDIFIQLDAPKSFSLSQNYPNPFNPETTIEFDLSEDVHVNLVLYNTRGQNVQTITDELYPAGQHQIAFNGQNLATGVYFYRLKTAGFEATKKMILIK